MNMQWWMKISVTYDHLLLDFKIRAGFRFFIKFTKEKPFLMFSRIFPSIPVIPGLEMKTTRVYENLCWYNYYVRHITPHFVRNFIFIRFNFKKILNRFAHRLFLNDLDFLEKFDCTNKITFSFNLVPKTDSYAVFSLLCLF